MTIFGPPCLCPALVTCRMPCFQAERRQKEDMYVSTASGRSVHLQRVTSFDVCTHALTCVFVQQTGLG